MSAVVPIVPIDDDVLAKQIEREKFLTANIGSMAPTFMFLGFALWTCAKGAKAGSATASGKLYYVASLFFTISTATMFFVMVRLNMIRHPTTSLKV